MLIQIKKLIKNLFPINKSFEYYCLWVLICLFVGVCLGQIIDDIKREMTPDFHFQSIQCNDSYLAYLLIDKKQNKIKYIDTNIKCTEHVYNINKADEY